MADTPQNGAEILARIKPRLMEDWVGICLRPDLIAAFEEADAALVASRRADVDRFAQELKKPTRVGAVPKAPTPSAETKRNQKKVDAILAEIGDSEVKFHFRARTKDEFRELCDAHEPREGNLYDFQVGYNRTAVSDDLVYACLFDPVFETCTEDHQHFDPATGDGCGTWQHVLLVIGAGQWQRLTDLVNKINQSVVQEPPKSQAAVLEQLVSAAMQQRDSA